MKGYQKKVIFPVTIFRGMWLVCEIEQKIVTFFSLKINLNKKSHILLIN